MSFSLELILQSLKSKKINFIMKNIKTANILLIVLIAVTVIGFAMWAFTKEELSDGVTSVPINKKIFGFGATKTTAKIQDLSNPSDPIKKEGV